MLPRNTSAHESPRNLPPSVNALPAVLVIAPLVHEALAGAWSIATATRAPSNQPETRVQVLAGTVARPRTVQAPPVVPTVNSSAPPTSRSRYAPCFSRRVAVRP